MGEDRVSASVSPDASLLYCLQWDRGAAGLSFEHCDVCSSFACFFFFFIVHIFHFLNDDAC